MKAQFVVVSAYMAVALLIVAMTIIYVEILPKAQSHLSVSNNLWQIREILYSRTSWSAESLAKLIYSQLNLKYVYVNITKYDLYSGKDIGYDYYIIGSTTYKPKTYIIYNFTALEPNGIIYVYNIKVGI